MSPKEGIGRTLGINRLVIWRTRSDNTT